MEILVRTKSHGQEYGFLAAAPDDWWVEYRKLATVELPGLLAWSDGRAWHALLTGIPTRRTDAAGRTITYSLLFQGTSAPVRRECEVMLGVVRTWLDWLDNPDGCPIGPGLDEHLGEEQLDRLLAAGAEAAAPGTADFDAPDEADVLATVHDVAAPAAAVREVAAKLGPAPAQLDLAAARQRFGTGPWIGSVLVAEDRRLLADAVEVLARGTSGFAGHLNVLRTAASAADAAVELARHGELSVVLAELSGQAVEEAKKSLAARPDLQSRSRRRGLLWVAGAGLAAAILAALVVWYLMRRT